MIDTDWIVHVQSQSHSCVKKTTCKLKKKVIFKILQVFIGPKSYTKSLLSMDSNTIELDSIATNFTLFVIKFCR